MLRVIDGGKSKKKTEEKEESQAEMDRKELEEVFGAVRDVVEKGGLLCYSFSIATNGGESYHWQACMDNDNDLLPLLMIGLLGEASDAASSFRDKSDMEDA